MSELIEINNEAPMLWRVRKNPDHAIYGPVDANTLKEWASSAQISPLDEIDVSDENWRPAPEIDFLEMLWYVTLPDEEVYGPTTLGTLREFINEGLISEKTLATHAQTQQAVPIGAIFAGVEFEKKRALRRPPREAKKSTASIAVDMAKDQRIRQLEEDLRELRHDHESLTQRYRQLSLQMQEATKRQNAAKSGRA
jgi:hypothetical protein